MYLKMKTVGLAVAFAFMVEYSLADKGGSFQVEKETEGTKDVLQVKDSSGKLLAIIDVYEGFQLTKPEAEDDNVCLVLPAFTEKTNLKVFKCYKRVPFPRDEYNADELAECGKREIFALQPQFSEYCSDNVDDDSKGEVREKRSCFWKENIVSTCVKMERVCDKWGWWLGKGRCKRYVDRCTKYQADRVREYVCY